MGLLKILCVGTAVAHMIRTDELGNEFHSSARGAEPGHFETEYRCTSCGSRRSFSTDVDAAKHSRVLPRPMLWADSNAGLPPDIRPYQAEILPGFKLWLASPCGGFWARIDAALN